MSAPVFEVSVIVRRVQLVNRWISEKWEIEAVEPSDARSDGIVREVLATDRWRWRGFRLDLHPSEGEGYYLNLREPDPRVFVMWRLEDWDGSEGSPVARPWVTTASYNEAARMMDGGETVDSVSMPARVREWIEPWLAANYKPEVKKKKQRNQDFWGDRKPSDNADRGQPVGASEAGPGAEPARARPEDRS